MIGHGISIVKSTDGILSCAASMWIRSPTNIHWAYIGGRQHMLWKGMLVHSFIHSAAMAVGCSIDTVDANLWQWAVSNAPTLTDISDFCPLLCCSSHRPFLYYHHYYIYRSKRNTNCMHSRKVTANWHNPLLHTHQPLLRNHIHIRTYLHCICNYHRTTFLSICVAIHTRKLWSMTSDRRVL